MRAEIKRDYYLNKLVQKKENGMVKVITGIRRCGKSYLLNNLFFNYLIDNGVKEDHIIRFAFDSAEDLSLIGENLITLEKEKRKADPEKFMNCINSQIKDNNTYFLLLDEVQLLDCFESVLNGYLRKSNIDVYVTGSNAKFLSKDIITEFAGRGDEIHMGPLNYSEFMSNYEGDRYQGLTDYMLYGGIPLVVLNDDINEKTKLLSRLFKEIYIKDIFVRNNIKNKGELEDLLNILSSSIGSLTNSEKIKNTFRSVKNSNITSNTIRKYLEYFEDSFLIQSAKRYDIKGKRYIESPCKYYFSDLGLRNARINFRQFEQNHSIENVIYNELIIRGYNVDIGVVNIVEKNSKLQSIRKQLEIDFVCNIGSKRIYIQSAYTIASEDKKIQELKPFTKLGDSFRKIIITNDLVPAIYNDDGILTVNIHDFLLDPEKYL